MIMDAFECDQHRCLLIRTEVLAGSLCNQKGDMIRTSRSLLRGIKYFATYTHCSRTGLSDDPYTERKTKTEAAWRMVRE